MSTKSLAQPFTPTEQSIKKTGVLIVNLGTPDSPSVPDVRRYLREFLMDERVIDIPFINRWLLINLIIAPFRAPKSAKIYRELWTSEGSPLKIYGYSVEKKLQSVLGDQFVVKLAMRYQSPSIASILAELKKECLSEIIVIPFFPQYASASTGSVYKKVMETVKDWIVLPEIKFINRFLDHPKFVEGFVNLGKKYMAETDYDHFVFSYHGIPERQITKGDVAGHCSFGSCCDVLDAKNQHCYRAQCYETTRLFVRGMGIPEGKYTVSFQSRLGKTPWIKPYTDEIIPELAQKGIKRVLAFSPAFVADCLETTIEVGEEYKELFEKQGGERWQLVESLNDSDIWIEALVDLVKTA
jgi:protoporphyrin/coproporphyrin ferrochelatase